MNKITIQLTPPNDTLDGMYNYIRGFNSYYYFGEDLYINESNGQVEVDLDSPTINPQTLKQIAFYASGKVKFKISDEDLKKLNTKIFEIKSKQVSVF